ncbi:hypothetical protein Pcac1_g5380 [Phytophthora cactorum]|nr:hypothetical protein Pcac1_g5380 [Phytophthora cactorum]
MREPGELDRVWSDKTIFIMTPEEAIKEAARSGQALWLDQLCTRYECRVPSALVAAAAHSHLGCVEILLKKNFDHVQENLAEGDWKIVRKATKAAGGTGISAT